MSPFNALTTWDPDGNGPLPAQLVAGGAFTTAGGVTVNGIAPGYLKTEMSHGLDEDQLDQIVRRANA